MQWLSAEEVERVIGTLPQPERLFESYALSLFVDRALYARTFEPSNDWGEAVILTESGQEMLRQLHANDIKYPTCVEHFTLFRTFYWQDLLIDYARTDCERIRGLLQAIHTSQNARWPYVFGSGLYHKFNDTYQGNRTDSLDAEAAERLLAGTPQGVFQVGRTLSGPLGFQDSLEERTLPPILNVHLWHCSDPGCRAPHTVRLLGHKSDSSTAQTRYLRYMFDSLGPASEWHRPIIRICRRGKWPGGRPYSDLPAILGDCIIGAERRTLCERILRSPHNPTLSRILRDSRGLQGTPDQMAFALSPEEQHQLLLMVPDNDLIHFVDDAIWCGQIHIPPAELRRKKMYAYGHAGDSDSELSSLGIRSTEYPPIHLLAAVIWNTYERLDAVGDLAWRVRGHTGSTLRHAVVDFIRVHGPEAAVRELILSSRNVTTLVASSLTLRVSLEEEGDQTSKRLLWKLGFDLARYEDEYSILRQRIGEFRDLVLQMAPQPSEYDRARVRGIGVNLFVSVEQFLENMLCYNVWLLASDHFTGTGFCYTRHDALTIVSRVIGQQIESGEQSLAWSVHGTNTLGVLVGYLHAFRAWLKKRPEIDKSGLQRRPADYPHYARDPLRPFPFRHTELWADVPVEVMAKYEDIVDRICIQIAQADLIAVRNGLDHKREENAFPAADRMLGCASRLQQVLDTADSLRLIPKLFWLTKKDQDADGNVCCTFADYRGEMVSLWGPSSVSGGVRRLFGVPYLVAPFDFLNQPNSIMLFRVSPRTEYRDYWRNYPRGRLIPAESSSDQIRLSRNARDELQDSTGGE